MASAIASLGPSVSCTGSGSDPSSCSFSSEIPRAGGSTWQGGATPPGRLGAALAYFPPQQEVVLFGGKTSNGAYLADTWTYRGGVWNETGAIGPAGRQDPSMAYYPLLGDLVLFGGYESGPAVGSSTWLFSGSMWTKSTAGGPSGRYDAAMTYDSTLAEIVLFGGITLAGTELSDTWFFSGSPGAWTSGPTSGPSARDGAVMADDPVNSEAVLFGGFSNGPGWHNDTWVLTSTAIWKNITIGLVPEPAARANEGMTWDSTTSTVIMTGGFGTLSPGSYNDTWSFVNGAWTLLTGTGDPFSGRSLTPLTYDPTDKEAVLFGGDAIGNSFQNDTWALSGSSLATLQWSPTHLAPLSIHSPPGRNYDSLAYDSTDNAVFLFGGAGAHIFNDLWEFQSGVWTNRTPSAVTATNNPPFRESGGMVWDNGTDTLYLFGGTQYGGATYLNDLWAYSVTSTSWSQVSIAGAPSARSSFGMVWDQVHGRILIGGGYGPAGFLSDMYTFSPTQSAWNLLTVALPQGNAKGLSLAWDANAGVVLDYGGDDGSVNYASTWTILLQPPSAATIVHISSSDLTGGVSDPWYAYSASSSTSLVFEGSNLNGPSIPLSSTLTFSTVSDSWTNIAASAGTPPDSLGESNLVTDTGGQFFFGAGGSPEITVPNGGGPTPYYAALPDWIFGPTLSSTLTFPSTLTSGATLSASIVGTGGSGNYRYIWYGLPAPCYSAATTLSCIPTSVASTTTFVVQVDAVDSLGDVSSHTVTLTQYASISSVVTVSPMLIDSGQSTTYSASPSGGSGVYTYKWQGLPAGCASPGNVSSFTCTPSSVLVNYTDAAASVVITDTAGGSSTISTPFLTIDAPLSASAVTASPAGGVDGTQAVQFSVVPTYGTAGYSFVWGGLPAGCTTADVRSLYCTTSAVGANTTSTVTVTVTDSLGQAAPGTPLSYMVHQDPYTSGVYLSSSAFGNGLNAATIDSGQTVSIYADPHGGIAPYTFSWNGLPPGCTASTTSFISCTPTGGSNLTYTIETQAKDSNGLAGKASFANLTVAPPLSVTAVSIVGNNPDDSGVAVQFEVPVSGGTGSYSFTWTGLPTGCTSSNVRILSCTPNQATNQTYSTIQVQVTDTGGGSLAAAAGAFSVHPAVSLGALVGNPPSIDSTQAVIFSATPSGGSGVYTFSWTNLPAPCATVNADQLSCTATTAANATYGVTLIAQDSLGEIASTSLTYTVHPVVGVASVWFLPSSLDAGQSVQIFAIPTGGTGSYTFTWTGLPTGSCSGTTTSAPVCVTSASSLNTSYAAVQATARDTNGLTASRTAATLQVNGDPQVSSISVSSSPMDSSELLTLSVVPSSGSGSYTFLWANLPTGCSPVNERILSCTPSVASNTTFSSVMVQLTDSLGKVVSSPPAVVTVYSYPVVSAITITPTGGVDSGDHAITLSVSVSGGSGTYTFSWSGLPTGCSTANTPHLTCTPSVGANLTFGAIAVVATDTVGGHPVSPAASYTVYQDPQLSVILASANPVDSGQTLTLQATPLYGDGVYAFSWTGLPPFCTAVDARTLSCTVSVTSNTTYPGIHLCLNDTSYGMACAPSMTLQALVAPTVSAIVASPAGQDDSGVVATFSVTASGGEAGYTFAWTGLPSGCSSQDTPHLTCTPATLVANQTYSVQVTMKDTTGVTVPSNLLSYEVYPALQVSSVSVSPGLTDSGTSVTISAVATLGSGSYAWSWTSLPTGCAAANSRIILCAPTVTTNQTFTGISVTVSDQIGPALTAPAGSLRVDALPKVSKISSWPSSGTIESGLVLTLNATAALGSGGYSFTWTGLPAGCTTQDSPYLQCTPSVPSNFTYSTIQVQVLDSSGTSVISSTATVQVLARVVLSSIGTTPKGAVVDSGQSVTFSARASLGDGSYSFLWTTLPSGCVSNGLPDLTCTPTSATNTTVSVQLSVTDGQSVVAQSTLSFRVLEDPQLGAISYSANPAESGIVLTLTVHASFGNGSYVFLWSNLPTGCTGVNAPSLSCVPLVSTNTSFGTISAQVTDSLGATSSQSGAALEVLKAVGVSVITASPAAGVDSGQTLVLSVAASGGNGVYTFSWTSLPTGCASADTPHLSCTPSVSANQTFTGIGVTVTDGLSGSIASATVSYVVWADPQVTPVQFSANPVDSGQTLTMRVVASAGDGAYSFLWTGLPTGCSTVSSPELSCSPTASVNTTVGPVQVQVIDGTSFSVTSAPPSPPLVVEGALQTAPIVVSASPVESGQSLTLSERATQGSGSYAFAWSNLPLGCTGSDTPVILCVPSVAVNTTFSSISVLVTDTLGGSGSPAAATVAVVAHLALSSVTSSRWEMEVGESVTFSATPSLGDGSYSFVWSALPSCVSGNAPTLTCTASVPGLTAVSVTATDGLGTVVASASFDMQVLSGVSAGTLVANLSSLDLGYSVKLTVSPTQGLGPYTEGWSGLPAGCVPSNTSALVCAPTVTGSFWIRSVVSDVLGGTNYSSAIDLLVSSGPSISSLVGNPWSVDVGQTTALTATVAGGAGSLTYLWGGLPAGCASSDLATLPCTPSAAGSTTVTLQVTDTQGGFASASLPITVYNDLAVTLSTPSGTSTETGVALPIAASVSAGSPGYHRFVWSINSTGPVSPPDNTSTFDLLVVHGGSYLVSVMVYDSNAYPGTGTSPTLTVVFRLSVLIRSGYAPVLDVGQSSSLQAAASGGLGTLSWQWFDGSVAIGTPCLASTCTFTPTATGTHHLTVVATDSAGLSSTSRPVNITVNTPPAVSMQLSFTTKVGQPVTLDANVTPGTPGYRYVWYVNGSLLPVQSGPLGTYTFSAAGGGSYQVWVVVNDSVGVSVKSANSTILVGPATATVGLVLTLAGTSGNSISLDGQTYTSNGTVVLGLHGTYSLTETPGQGYTFVSWQTGGGVTVPNVNSGATTVTVDGPGTLTAVFAHSSSTSPTHNPGNGGGIFSGGLFLVLLLIILVAAVLAGALLLRSRRRSGMAAAPSSEAAPPPPASFSVEPTGGAPPAPATPAGAASPAPSAPSGLSPGEAGVAATLAAPASTVSTPSAGDWQEDEAPTEDWQEDEASPQASPVSETPSSEAGEGALTGSADATESAAATGVRPKVVLGTKGPRVVQPAGETSGAKIVPKEPPWPMVPLTMVESVDKVRFWRMAAASGLDRSKMMILSLEAPGIVTGTYGMHGASIYRLSRSDGENNVSPGDADRLGYLIESHFEKGSGRAVVLDGIASVIDATNIRTARRLVELTHEMAEKTSGAALVWVNPETMGQVERRQLAEKAVVRRLR